MNAFFLLWNSYWKWSRSIATERWIFIKVPCFGTLLFMFDFFYATSHPPPHTSAVVSTTKFGSNEFELICSPHFKMPFIRLLYRTEETDVQNSSTYILRIDVLLGISIIQYRTRWQTRDVITYTSILYLLHVWVE